MRFRRLWIFLVTLATVAGLAALALWQAPTLFSSPLPAAVPLQGADQEIAFLQPATNVSDWERFLEALLHVQKSTAPEEPPSPLKIDASRAFPDTTDAVPEVAWRPQNCSAWIRVRWYKLTSATDVDYWVSRLAVRSRPPLAIIGGDTSNRAETIARTLQMHCGQSAAPPRFLITTATADRVGEHDLMAVYPDRTFRFCFTNRQMAQAIADFLWTRKELNLLPDSGPVYLVGWQDSSYSLDLVQRFRDALPQAPLAPVNDHGPNSGPFWFGNISHSIGTFGRPSPEEITVAERLLDELDRRPAQRQALLVLPANSWPARRFLHAVSRAAPLAISRFVVVNGDAIDFNTVYRDGNVTWPIQNLPFQLVLFCHRNPVDRQAGFRAATNADVITQDLGTTTSADSGTYDLLLYADIINAITEAAFRDGRLLGDVQAFDKNLRRSRFDTRGNRLDGSGEHVVYLQPERSGGRVLPQARLRVYRRTAGGWELQPPELRLTYGLSAAEAGKEKRP